MMDFGPLWLSAQLASVTTAILILLGAPLAWWWAKRCDRQLVGKTYRRYLDLFIHGSGYRFLHL